MHEGLDQMRWCSNHKYIESYSITCKGWRIGCESYPGRRMMCFAVDLSRRPLEGSCAGLVGSADSSGNVYSVKSCRTRATELRLHVVQAGHLTMEREMKLKVMHLVASVSGSLIHVCCHSPSTLEQIRENVIEWTLTSRR